MDRKARGGGHGLGLPVAASLGVEGVSNFGNQFMVVILGNTTTVVARFCSDGFANPGAAAALSPRLRGAAQSGPRASANWQTNDQQSTRLYRQTLTRSVCCPVATPSSEC